MQLSNFKLLPTKKSKEFINICQEYLFEINDYRHKVMCPLCVYFGIAYTVKCSGTKNQRMILSL